MKRKKEKKIGVMASTAHHPTYSFGGCSREKSRKSPDVAAKIRQEERGRKEGERVESDEHILILAIT